MACRSVWLKAPLDEGVPGPEHFDIVDSDAPKADDVSDGEVLVEVRCMSVDPYLRMRIKSPNVSGRSIMSGFVSGKVVASKNAAWKTGDLFGGSLPFSTVQVVDENTAKGMWKLTGLLEESRLSYGVGVLGMPGATAYGGVVGVIRPEAGKDHTLFVSAASGAVGSLVGQIAKNVYGCHTVGSCGGPAKCALIKSDFGYDVAIDYKKLDGEADLLAALKEAAPKGIDSYYEMVGGIHFTAALKSLRNGGRIAVCGGISGYNTKDQYDYKFNPMSLVYSSQRIEGFLSTTWLQNKEGDFLGDMSKWLNEGKIENVAETFYDGIDQWPVAFQSLFKDTHRNKGKVVVRMT